METFAGLPGYTGGAAPTPLAGLTGPETMAGVPGMQGKSSSMDPAMIQQMLIAMEQAEQAKKSNGLVGATTAQAGPQMPIGYGKSLTDNAPSFAGLLQQLMRYPGTVS